MLRAIKSSIIEVLNMNDEIMDETADKAASIEDKRWARVQSYILKNESVRNADVCQLLDVSPATANRHLCVDRKEQACAIPRWADLDV